MDNNGSGSGDACPEQELDPPSLLLMLPLLLSLVWILLDIFYSSALFGWAVTRLPTLFLTDSAIHLGGIQVSLLTGRILFRDLHYYCRDFSIRVTDGYVAFHWWKRVGVGDYSLCCPGSPERRTALVRFQLNGFQLHWYNRSDVYDTWGQVGVQDTPRTESGSDESLLWSLWKELRPSLHFNINKGRMVFGNHLLERSLTVYCQTARAHYHTTEASNAYDELMHVVKVWTSEVKAVMEPSNYPATAVSENVEKITPLLRSDSATVTYSWDSPGSVQLGDSPDPKFSWDVELGSNAVINYGSYANHQRHLLQSFFFPNDYTERPASHIPRAGENRIYTNMEVTVRLSSRGAFNIPFQDEKNRLHQIGLSLGKGSEIKVHQPWITNENGYTTSVTGVLEDVVITSDLSYPHLANATSLQLNVELSFPRVWNSTQRWDMQLSASQVEVSILFSYIDFINALIDDWLGSDEADLLHFVPIEWTINLSLSDYEIYMFTSRYNWLDKDGLENTRLAFCGSTGKIKLHFPFTVFNPIEQRVAFTANGQDLVVRHFVPPSCSSREAVLALNSANKYHWRVMQIDGHSEIMSGHQRTADMFTYNREADSKEVFPMGYRGHTHLENGWVDLACGPSISLVIDYVSRAHHSSPALPNTMQVDIDAPTVLLRVFGFLMTDLLALKENYPGEYIDFSTYHSTSLSDQYAPLAPRSPLGEAPPAAPPTEVPDEPRGRFADVVVDFTLRNITAEFPTFPSQGKPVDATLPSVCTDKLAVHVEYTSSDTKVFLYVSPLTVLIPSWPSGAAPELGHVACGGLQLNCHGLTEMLCGERVEYAWLMQLQIQRITAALTTLQLAEVVSWLQATVHQVVGVADATVAAPNGHLIKPLVEPLSEDIKYLLFDLCVGEADVCLLEGGGVLRLQSPGLDMGLCKLHCDSETLGMSLQLHALTCSVCTPVAGEPRTLSEAGRLDIGLVQGDIALQEPKDCVPSRQLAFLKRADTRTRRLWFLWGEVGCGCWGGCQFLDDCIKRSPPRLPSSCAVYNSECSLPSGTLSRAFGLHSLKQSLQSVSLHDLECPTLLHHGLLAYYDQRYQSVGDTSPSQPSAGSDTESFVSALASPDDSGSQSDTNEFYSLENVNEAGLEGHTFPEQLWRRPRSKTEGGNVSRKKSEAAHVLAEDSTLHSILPSFVYHTIPLHISITSPSQELRDRLPHCRQHSDTPFSTETGPIHTRSASDIPLTPPPMNPRSTRGRQSTTGNILLRLPLLLPQGRGHMPILNMSASQEKNTSAECGQSDEQPPQFTVGVNISVLEPVSATLSPLITHLITSMTTSLTYYFQQRGALAVLTGCSLDASLSLNSYLSQLLQPSSEPQPFSAHISLGMNPKAFAGVQFVQSFPQHHWHYIKPEPPSGASVPHCSLVSAALCGLQVSSLIQTHTESVAEDEDNHATVSSLQLSLKGGCSSVQLSLAVQFSDGTFPSSFPNLLSNSSRLEVVVGPSPGFCSLLETACLLPSFTAAAKVVTLEVSHKAVLTWKHVHSHPLRREVNRLASNQQEEVKNKVAVSVSMPQVWVDVAAPCTGRPGPSTGGLDLLVGREVGVAWLRQLKVMTSSVQELMDTKLARDRRVLLAVLTNATRSTPQQKAGCVLLTPVAAAVRHCVTFHCLHQLWTSLSAYSDLQLGFIPPSHSCSVELMAVSLSLATRLFSGDSSVEPRKLQSSPVPIDPTSCPSCGPSRHRPPAPQSDASSHSAGGYVRGVSPSPSELALPNIVFSTQQLDQVDSVEFEELYRTVSFTTVVVIRESLLPLLKAIGTPTTPQLRALCHNQHQFHLDCSVQLREGTVFVLEPSSSRSLPALRVEHAAVRGHLQVNWATPATQPPNLCLLSSNTESTPPHSSKRNISGLFSANVGILSVGITVPLMKLSRHLIETSRFLAQKQKPTKPTTLFTVADTNAETETDTAFHQPSDMWHFIQELVGQLTALQEETLQTSVRQTEAGPSQVSLSRPSPVESAHSRSIRSVIADYSCSPKNIIASSPPPCHPSPPTVPAVPLHTTTSHDSSTSEVAIEMEQVEAPLATSPASQSPLDTSGGDFPSSDEIQLLSGSQRISSSILPPTTSLDASVASQAPEWLNDTGPLQQTLGTPLSQLSHSIFGLLRLDSLSFTLQVESSTTSLRLAGVTGSVDSRQLATCPNSLPAYLSVIATITTTQLGVSDRALTESEILRVVSQPIHCSLGLSNSRQLPVATYRCLLKVQGCKLVGKQPPVLVHKRFQQLLPTFTKIYQDVLSPLSKSTSSQPHPQSSSLTDMEMPSQLPQGYTHFSLSRLELVMTPLPSLSITYTVQPLVAHVETAQKICYQLSIGSHTLRFNPREHQVSLRSLVLPNVTLSGNVRRSQASRMPQVCMKFAVQTVNIDLTTDSLNQLLVLQSSFIKEMNELVQLFISMGDSLPQQRWQPPSSSEDRTDGHRPGLERRDSTTEPSELLSLLDSCQLSIDEICITVSTPLCTALRFSTSRIDMHVMNSGHQPPFPDMPVTRSLLLLSGRVDINVNLALGYLQDSSSEDDDFCELAYFRTKISIKNTQQRAPRLSLVAGASKEEASQPLDTFIISIISPHLYIQSSAVEQAILFWLNCKSVYSYWQHQRKLLNEEVQQATERFVAQIQSRRPTTLQTPSLDFSKPRLVQIIVTDVGACMPMAAVLHTPQSSQKPFPALVLTIKEMLLVVNLSRKVASSGNFTGFCVRFANQFTLRQRTWTMDPKKNKMINSGIVNQGTFRLCVATKKRRSATDNSVVLGEKLVWAFQWDMSGIDVNANIDIGHHMSTLVRTATTIGTNLEEQQPTHLARSDPATPPSKPPRKLHKRAMSEVGPSRHEAKRHRMEEGLTNLAKGTIQVSTLQSSGASRDSLKREFEALKETEQELRKRVGRLFRRRGFNIQRIAEFFRSPNTEREGSMRRRWTLRHPRRLFSTGDHQPSIPEEEEEEEPPDQVQDFPPRRRAQTISTGVRHARTVSDVTDERPPPHHKEEDGSSSSPSLTPSVTPVPGEEGSSSFPPTPISSTPLPHSAFTFHPEGSSPRHQRPADLMASIDVEVNVTVNIESGIIKLRSREESEKTSSPDLLATSPSTTTPQPLQLRRLQGRTRDSCNDRVILLIPALNVQVHYKSIVGQSYQFPSPSSSILLSTPTAATSTPTVAPNIKVTPSTPVSATQPELPTKRGVLSISVIVASTPEDMTLTPSLLEFVEQVVRPTIAATVDTKPDSSSDSDTGDDSEVEEMAEEGLAAKEDSPISFPVDVTITFHMQPSTIRLSCYPHSRVHCIVCSPNVNFVVSFSLFSQQETEGALPSPGPTSGVTFNNLFVTGCLETFTLQLLSPQVSALKQHSDTTKMDNKEALSLTLGQALTHLSRKSVLVASTTSPVSSMNESSSHSKLQVSVVTNIASLVLGYDMRRLNDLSAFRRYWYRTSLIESFIGSKKPHQTPTATVGGGGGEGERAGEDDNSSTVTTEPTVDSSISAVIVVAAKVEDFRISANVAQVMGNTNLVVTHLQCQAHADISRNELVLLKVAGQMEKGEVDARGGMVAGFLLMQDVQTKVTSESHQGLVPVHTAQMSLSRAEARVDYMSSCILLGQASQFEGAVRDLWKGLQLVGQDGEGENPNIEVLVELSWAHMQLAIHRTTTKSVMNIVQKIQDFVLQQKRRSERTISIMLPADTKASKALAAYREKEKLAGQKKDVDSVGSQHHWLWATRFGSLELMRALGVPARSGQRVSLGGKLTLSGQNVCLVCFHGTSFRDHEWAVFNIDQLKTSFFTLAIPGLGAMAGPLTPTCQQICRLQLGEDGGNPTELATVHRVTAGRGRVAPITGTNINNWLSYACIDCHLHKQSYDHPTAAQQTVLKFSKKLTIQQILLVPGLSVELTNNHFWPELGWQGLQQTPPLVECSLSSQFSAGISVSTNVEHYLFLHDLVKNYIEYLERHKAPLKDAKTSESVKEKERENVDSGLPLRQFTCVRWELDPRLTLLSSVSGEFNPHINWLLETLGFKHARTTIPKWLQRGAMDPLDKAMAVALEVLIQFSAKKKLSPLHSS